MLFIVKNPVDIRFSTIMTRSMLIKANKKPDRNVMGDGCKVICSAKLIYIIQITKVETAKMFPLFMP